MIICAAIKDTSTGQVFYGLRHEDIYDIMHCFGYNTTADFLVEGFVDNRNNFYNRHEAFIWAHQIGQLSETVLRYKNDHDEGELYSEDLY